MNNKKKFFYGWIIVAALFLVTMLPMVFISNFFSYYQVPICEEFGCSYAEFNISNVASTIAGILFSLALASKVGKGRTRLFMLAGGLVAAAAIYFQSCITAVWQLYITFFAANFAFSAMTYVPINLIISNWFVDRKGLVTSIVFAGSGLGGMVFSSLAADIIANSGWRMGFRLTAIITAIVAVLVFLLVRKSPAEMGLEPYAKSSAGAQSYGESSAGPADDWPGLSKAEALRTGSFWLYAACLVCCGIVAAGVFTQVPTYLIENGVDYAPVMAVFNGVTVVGMVAIGPIIDKLGLKKGCVLTCLVAVVALICLMLVPQFGSAAAYACMIIIPFGAGITSLAPPLLTGSMFGYRDYSGIYGLGNSCFMIGCMIGPVLSSGLRDGTGSYQPAWIAMAAAYVLLAATAVLAASAAKKLHK